MKDRYTFEDLKDEETLVKFLQNVWKAGVITGMIHHGDTVQNLIDKEYMPKFKEELSK